MIYATWCQHLLTIAFHLGIPCNIDKFCQCLLPWAELPKTRFVFSKHDILKTIIYTHLIYTHRSHYTFNIHVPSGRLQQYMIHLFYSGDIVICQLWVRVDVSTPRHQGSVYSLSWAIVLLPVTIHMHHTYFIVMLYLT